MVSGFLTKHAGLGKRSHQRFFVLTKSFLNYYVTDQMIEKKGSIPLTDIKAIRIEGDEGSKKRIRYEHSFTILTDDKYFFLQSDRREDAKNWIESLKENISRISGKTISVSGDFSKNWENMKEDIEENNETNWIKLGLLSFYHVKKMDICLCWFAES